MRKAPSKTSNGSATPTDSTPASLSLGTSRRTTNLPSPGASTASQGAFSFAAAASGGANTQPKADISAATDRSSVGLTASDADSLRYSKHLLSLYSTEKEPKADAHTSQTAPSTGAASFHTPSKKKQGVYERDGRAVNGTSSEPRGLNARSASSSYDKPPSANRSGLFQRGVSSTNLSPTASHPRDRERHGSGIQGGVLSGVGHTARRNKDNDRSSGVTVSPREDDHSWDRKSTAGHSDVFGSVRNRAARGGDDDFAQEGEVLTKDAWARLRRERWPGEGPLGPPADHSGGFLRYSGLNRKRERQASHRYAPPGQGTTDEKNVQGDLSSDVDLNVDAVNLVDSLKLDDDDDDENAFSKQDSWTPETAEWLYKDLTGQIQGPFKANIMQEWYAAKYFTEDLMVRRSEVETFAPLGKVLAEIGDSHIPFLIPPSRYKINTPIKEPNGLHARPLTPAMLGQQVRQVSLGNASPSLVQNFGWGSAVQPDFGYPGVDGGRQSPFAASNPAYTGIGTGSPFATPPSAFAELRPRNQDDYLNMIRQRELAEFRAIQEQRASQFALAQGRDPATLGLWGNTSGLPNNDFAQQYLRPDALQPHNLMHDLSTLSQQPQATHLGGPHFSAPAHGAVAKDGHVVQNVALEHAHSHQNVASDHAHSDADGATIRSTEASAPPTEEASVDPQPTHSALGEQEGDTAPSLPQQDSVPVGDESIVSNHISSEAVESRVEPTTVPPNDEEAWQEGEFIEKTKKGKRTKKVDAVREEQPQPQQPTPAHTPAGIQVVGEEQFKRSQPAKDNNQRHVLSSMSNSGSGAAPPAVAKAAPWANSTPVESGQQMSLRDIQEAEARKAQAAKALMNERRQKMQSSNATLPTSEASIPTSMSWGLPSVPSTLASVHHTDTTTTSPSNAAPAWNANTKAAPKKTLTEIQEEERKRALRAREVQVTSKSRGYADSAGKVHGTAVPATPSQPSPQASAAPPGHGWSVVGASGKVATPTSAPAPQPRTVGGPAANGLANKEAPKDLTHAPLWTSQTTGAQQKPPATSSSTGPSNEFIKYCKEQLKGLNVKVDDFIEMLLSFPLHPSPDTVEIIADSVYANSSTLDGRRFAADFVAKRKLDAVGQNTNAVPAMVTPAQAPSAPRSASDAVKSRSTGDPLGGFKVVKPKGGKKRM